MTNAAILRTGRASFWNAENIAQLLDMRQAGKTHLDIGQALGITEGAVNHKVTELRKLGVPIPKRPTGTPAGYKPALPYRKPGLLDVGKSAGAETRAKVQARAQLLMRFWHAKGAKHVQAWVECSGKDRGGHAVYEIRSNLVNGLPPKAHPAKESETRA